MKVLKIVALALTAGAIAITVHILLLNLADAFGIVTARGGLQRLVRIWVSSPIVRSGLGDAWLAIGLPGPDTQLFRTSFKVCVAFGMAIFYAFVIHPKVKGSALRKGLLYAFFIWLINAFVVLPLLGEGIAGARVLTMFGMLWFAAAHTTFFLILATVHQRLIEAWTKNFQKST